jgi:CRP-like cAMP-binding protein
MSTCRNAILAGLPKEDFGVLLPFLEPVRLKERSILQQSRQRLEYVNFVEAGMVSARMLDSHGILETALIGHQGVVGASVALGCRLSTFQSVVVAPGSALRIRAQDLSQAMQRRPAIREALLHYVHDLMIGGAQRALCVARHGSERRVACWVCLAHEALGERSLPVTQEELSVILGLRRASVADILKRMEDDGLVRRTRGVLEIICLDRIERMTCGCNVSSYSMGSHERNPTPAPRVSRATASLRTQLNV